ncbi:uncharacterized protein LOC133538142 [Nerophis ophidion]|uniref:uncharacterized protein LOC133538142 n=1 Tax=Nerophis ophidion TaxID=159077 RepID=UPI002ADF960A|nr:uncharacterized protein LOC133538142 [Nerophis ophidion]
MKDLSALSRGCGRVVKMSTCSDHGRLDVCFTPRDYYIWKSQDALLRLTASGSFLRNEESSIPKTYSTRRGALVLYSRDLVTLASPPGPLPAHRKRGNAQEVDRHALTLKERTVAILGQVTERSVCGSTLSTTARLGPPILPPLGRHCHPHIKLQHSPEFLSDTDPQGVPAHLDHQNPPEGQKENNRRVRLDVLLQIPRVTSSPPSCTMDHGTVTLEESPESCQRNHLHSPEGPGEHRQTSAIEDRPVFLPPLRPPDPSPSCCPRLLTGSQLVPFVVFVVILIEQEPC